MRESLGFYFFLIRFKIFSWFVRLLRKRNIPNWTIKLEQTDQPDVRQAMIVLLTIYQTELSLTRLIQLCELGDYPRLRELTCREILYRVNSLKESNLTQLELGLRRRLVQALNTVLASSPYQKTKNAAKQLKDQIPVDEVATGKPK